MKRLVTDKFVSALFENGEIREIYINDGTKCGNIYAGIVEKILPNQIAFVNIGLEKSAFLYLNDKKQSCLYENGKLKIKQGDCIMVQIEKDETDIKGASVTASISFSGKYAVVLTEKTLGISKKIYDEQRRSELKEIYDSLNCGFGIIMRTSCKNAADDEIKKEIESLCRKAEYTLQRGRFIKPPAVIEKGEEQREKIIRDVLNDDDEIVSDDEEICEKIKNIHKVVFYNDDFPMKYYYGITAEIKKALRRKVWLKSGGFIIFDFCEACTAIDVNSGKNILKNHESNAFRTNKEAAEEIIRQIILRNISGMIFIDFIDMKEKENIAAILNDVKRLALKDRAGINVLGISELNVMQLTRKKTGKSLDEMLTCRCPLCKGTGRINNDFLAEYERKTI